MVVISETMNKRSLLFCRVSSKEQEMGQSIDAQLQNLRSYCQRQNLRPVSIFQSLD